ncbi:hypothetical protein [Cobetia marina]|uniref:hypothetical protein n=1 Tax=Cobetia marina TaxID=28258 RepID=UPI0038576F8B
MNYADTIKAIATILAILPLITKHRSFKKEQEDKLLEYVWDQLDQDQPSNSYGMRVKHYFLEATGMRADENLIKKIVVASNNIYILRRFKYIKGGYYQDNDNYKIYDSHIEKLAVWSFFVLTVYFLSLIMLHFSTPSQIQTLAYRGDFNNFIQNNQYILLLITSFATGVMIHRNQERAGICYNFALATGATEYWANWKYPKNSLTYPILGVKIIVKRLKRILSTTLEWVKNKIIGLSNP